MKISASLFFPEGTRHAPSNDGASMLPFKKGAFHMAISIGIPILPVVISEYDFIDTGKKIFGECRWNSFRPEVTLNVLKPIQTEDLTLDDMNQLIEKTRNKMIQVFEETKTKKRQKSQCNSSNNDVDKKIK